MRRFLPLLAASLLLVACGDDAPSGGSAKDGNAAGRTKAAADDSGLATPEGWPPVSERQLDPSHEPTPFSAAQIAAACGPDTKRVLRFEVKGQDTHYKLWTFSDQTADGAVWHDSECDEHGVENGERKSNAVTWRALQSHASWPAADVTAGEARLKTPAGDFQCMTFSVRRTGGQGTGEDRFWFAWDLPGPPLRLERYVKGNLMVTITLVKVEGVKPQ